MLRIPAIFLAVAVLWMHGTQAPAFAAVPAGTEQRAYMNESCIVSDEPYYLAVEDNSQIVRSLPLAGIIVGKLVNAFVNGAVKVTAGGLDAISQHKDMHYLAANNVNLYRASLADSPGYRINAQLACATVVVAGFQPDGSDCTDRYIPRELPEDIGLSDDLAESASRQDETVENILRRANICVDGKARSVYEIRFTLSQDRTAYRLESAGIWVNGLLSTNSEKAKRSLIYTLDILEPATDTSSKILSTAWVNIGEVYPGLISNDPAKQGRSDWLQVPAMSRRASSAYERDTSVHSDVYAEIQALERAVVRNRRLLDGINKRLSTASESAREMLQSEADTVEFKMLRAESLLDAQRAEYYDLPQSQLQYMPVTVRLGIIESRNEKRALNALSSVLKGNSERIANTASAPLGYERSADLLGEPAASSLEQSRIDYFDAMVVADEARNSGDGAAAEAEQQLLLARQNYNEERVTAGIPKID